MTWERLERGKKQTLQYSGQVVRKSVPQKPVLRKEKLFRAEYIRRTSLYVTFQLVIQRRQFYNLDMMACPNSIDILGQIRRTDA